MFCAELWKHIATTYNDINETKDKLNIFKNLKFVGLRENWYFKDLWRFNEFKELSVDTESCAKGKISFKQIILHWLIAITTEPSSKAEESKEIREDEDIDYSEPAVKRAWGRFVLNKFPQALNLIYHFLQDPQSKEEVVEKITRIAQGNVDRLAIIKGRISAL